MKSSTYKSRQKKSALKKKDSAESHINILAKVWEIKIMLDETTTEISISKKQHISYF